MLERRRRTALLAALTLTAVVGGTAAALATIQGGATTAERAERGDQRRIAELVPHAATPYVVPVADVRAASWGDTHSSYPATDVFAGCGARLVSPVSGALLEVRRVNAYDPAVDNPANRGGRSVSILGDDGVRYYLAHFDVITTGLHVVGEDRRGPELGVGDDAEFASPGSFGHPPRANPPRSGRAHLQWPAWAPHDHRPQPRLRSCARWSREPSSNSAR